MPAIEEKSLDDLIDQVKNLKKSIETAGEDSRTKLAAVNVEDVLDPAAKSSLDDEGRKKFYIRVVQVRDSLRAAINEDGPPEPDHIMHVAFPTTFTIVVATVISVAIVLGLFWGVFTLWDDAMNVATAKESRVLLMVALLGGLGGGIHLVGSLAKYIGNRQLKRSWLIYYLSLPLVGGTLAVIVYLLLRVGILTPSAGTADPTGALKNLNLIGIYAFAALTGMFATTATDKLRDVFGTIFRTERPSKDGIGAEKAPGVAPAVAPSGTGGT